MITKKSFPNCNKPVCHRNFCLPPSSIFRASLLPQVATRSAVTSTVVSLISVTRPQPSARNCELSLLFFNSTGSNPGKSRHFCSCTQSEKKEPRVHIIMHMKSWNINNNHHYNDKKKTTNIHPPILLRIIK